MKLKSHLCFIALLGVSISQLWAAPTQEMLDKAENENDPSSMMFVAIEYCKDGNIEKAFYWKEREASMGAARGHVVNFLDVGNGFRYGLCEKFSRFNPNYDKALEFYLKAYNYWNSSKEWLDDPSSYIIQNLAKLAITDMYYFYSESLSRVRPRELNILWNYEDIANLPDDQIWTEKRGVARARLAQIYYFKHTLQTDELAYKWALKALKDRAKVDAQEIKSALEYISSLGFVKYEGFHQIIKEEAISQMKELCGLFKAPNRYCDSHQKMVEGTFSTLLQPVDWHPYRD